MLFVPIIGTVLSVTAQILVIFFQYSEAQLARLLYVLTVCSNNVKMLLFASL